MASILRQRRVTLKNVKELDAFPKIPEPYVETTASGGTISIISFGIILSLIVLETYYFFDTHFRFHISPDTDLDAKLKINVDMTVAMPCEKISADILDTTKQTFYSFGQLKLEPTWFELSKEQRFHFDSMKEVNAYLREEYHALKDLLWKSGYTSLFGDTPKRGYFPDRPKDGCRIHGSLLLNKVAGNLHVTTGKSLPLVRGHVHVAGFMSEKEYNFSHRIERFSFGDMSPGIIHPLEGDEKIAGQHQMLYQYFLSVVSTDVNTMRTRLSTYQYSVRDVERVVSHSNDSHGIPGIYFKYDMSGMKVRVTEESETLCQFLVRLCATVGGIHVMSGIFSGLLKHVVDFVLCRKPDVNVGVRMSLEPPAKPLLVGVAHQQQSQNLISLTDVDDVSVGYTVPLVGKQ